jgi:hypothetical protein
MASAGMVLGVGLTAVAFMFMQPNNEFVVEQDPALITVEQPAIVVQAPDNTELNENFSKLSASLDSVITAQNTDRQQMVDLTEQILESESQKDALRQAMADLQEQHQLELDTLREDQQATQSLPIINTPPVGIAIAQPQPSSKLVIQLNALLAADGYSRTQFQTASLASVQPDLRDVIVLNWNADGQLASMIEAELVELELHKMSHTLVMRFKNGSRTVGSSSKVALQPEGMRLEFSGLTIDAWLDTLPGLIPETTSEVQPLGVASVDEVRSALDALISKRGSFSYYKLSSLDKIAGDELKYVQINWHDNSGRLVKTIEADSLVIVLHKSGSVELQMRNGAFLSGGQRSPFSSDRFSLHLPRQDLKLWRESLVPTREAGY